MGLVYRDGRPYLYRSIRRGGRVTSQYLARGTDALLIAALEADERDQRRCDLEEARGERREVDDLERALDEMAERARDLARKALTAAGAHLHHRGEWRKRRASGDRESEGRRADDGRLGGRQLIDWATGKEGDAKTKAELRDELYAFAAELAGPSPSPIEIALADAAATAWFTLPDVRGAGRVERQRRGAG